jgi:hypothetical protein
MTSLDLTPVTFLFVLNVLLLIVGCADGHHERHLHLRAAARAHRGDARHRPHAPGIIFIVNLEIGYLTPPIGLNLFVASTLFDKPLGYVIKSVLPFIALMSVGLMVITYYPPISGDLGRWITGSPAFVPPMRSDGGGELGDEEVEETHEAAGGTPACDNGIEGDFDCDGQVSMDEMMRLAEGGSGEPETPAGPSCDNGIEGDYDCDGQVSMDEMMRLADEQAAVEGASDEGASDEGASDEGATDEGSTDEGSTDEGASDEGASDEGGDAGASTP